MTKVFHKDMAKQKDCNMSEPNSIFGRECLSKSIQWLVPDLIKQPVTKDTLASLEEQLQFKWKTSYVEFGNLSDEDKYEMLLLEMQKTDYQTMEACLNVLNAPIPDVIKDVWELSNQYLNTNIDDMVCVCCKIRNRVDIKHCSRYLHRHNIVSHHLHQTIICRNSNIGSQEDLWNELEKECDKYHTPKHIVEAIYSGLCAQGNRYMSLLTDTEILLNEDNPSFKCTCQQACSQMFMPNGYKLGVRCRAKSFDIHDKENQRPVTDPKVSRKHRKRHSGGKHISGETKQVHATKINFDKDTQEDKVTVVDEGLNFGQKHSEVGVSPPNTEAKRILHQGKQTVDHSTTIYNFYNNKGPLSFGTNVVKVKSSRNDNTQPENTETDSNTSQEDRLVHPSKLTGEETEVKRLKYSLPPLPAITYPTETETSDDSEYVSSTSNIDVNTNARTNSDANKEGASMPRSSAAVFRIGQLQLKPNNLPDRTARGILLQRQKSAPCGF